MRLSKKPNPQLVLESLAARGFESWLDSGGDLFATIHRHRCPLHLPIDASEVKDWIRRGYQEAHDYCLSTALLDQVISLAREDARIQNRRYETAIRVARHAGRLFLDLGTNDGHLICISPGSWKVLPGNTFPFRFIRPPGMLPLPLPVSNGSLRKLEGFIPGDDRTQRLTIAFALACLAALPHDPLLVISGPQGSGKTTLTQIIQKCVDPQAAGIRVFPKNGEDLFTAAQHCHVLAFDNLSNLKGDDSDLLCALSTGAAFNRRRMYTQGQEHALVAVRPVILNSITDLASRPDLVERSLGITLIQPDPHDRERQEALLARLEPLIPSILGGMLDALAYALDQPEPEGPLHRLADFSSLVLRAEPFLGWPAGIILRDLEGAQQELYQAALESYEWFNPLWDWLQDQPWDGPANELLAQLRKLVQPGPNWPENPVVFGKQLSRLEPALRSRGIGVERYLEPSGGRRRMLRISITST